MYAVAPHYLTEFCLSRGRGIRGFLRGPEIQLTVMVKLRQSVLVCPVAGLVANLVKDIENGLGTEELVDFK